MKKLLCLFLFFTVFLPITNVFGETINNPKYSVNIKENVEYALFSDDCSVVLMKTGINSTKIYRYTENRSNAMIFEHNITSLALSPDGKYFSLILDYKFLYIVDSIKAEVVNVSTISSLADRNATMVMDITTSEGFPLVAVGVENKVFIYGNNGEMKNYTFEDDILSISLSKNGKVMCVGTMSKIHIWNLEKDSDTGKYNTQGSMPKMVDVSFAGTRICAVTEDSSGKKVVLSLNAAGKIQWEYTNTFLPPFNDPNIVPKKCMITENSQRVMVLFEGERSTLYIFDDEGNMLPAFEAEEMDADIPSTWGPGFRNYCVISDKAGIYAGNISTAKILWKYNIENIVGVGISDNGRIIIITTSSGNILIFENKVFLKKFEVDVNLDKVRATANEIIHLNVTVRDENGEPVDDARVIINAPKNYPGEIMDLEGKTDSSGNITFKYKPSDETGEKEFNITFTITKTGFEDYIYNMKIVINVDITKNKTESSNVIAEIDGSGRIVVEELTRDDEEGKNLINAAKDKFEILSNILDVRLEGRGKLKWANISIKYYKNEVQEGEEVRMAYYDDDGEWKVIENSYIDKENGIVYANVTHLTYFAAVSIKTEDGTDGVPIYMQPGFIALFIIIVVGVPIGMFVVMKRTKGFKKSGGTMTPPPSPEEAPSQNHHKASPKTSQHLEPPPSSSEQRPPMEKT